MSLKDLSLTFTTSFSALMPEQYSPTNHRIYSTICCIPNAGNLGRPQVLRDHKSIAELQTSRVPFLVYVFRRNCRDFFTLLPFSQVSWKGEESGSET